MSLVVTKDNQDVAFVSHSDPARVMDSANNIRVTGSTAVTTDQRGFLELTIAEPSSLQTGEFTCNINALDHLGHVITFSTGLEIESSPPSTSDLVLYLREVDREKEQMKMMIEEMNTTMVEIVKKEADMEQEIEILKKQSDDVVVFGAGLTSSTSFSVGQTVVFDHVYLNVGSSYNSSSGVFTCDIPGYYMFTANSLSGHDQEVGLGMYLNDQSQVNFYSEPGHGMQHQSNTMAMKLEKGDRVQIKSYFRTSYLTSSLGDTHVTFTGFLVASS